MAQLFRKKPITVEAIRWTGNNDADILRFVESGCTVYHIRGIVHIPTLEGLMEARIGDWIIKGIKGDFYPCKDDVFRASYESVSEPSRGEDENG